MSRRHAGPILITGADRSGTSLVYALLASHSQVDMTRRANFWRWFDERFGDLTDNQNLDRCLAAIAGYRRLQVLEPDPDRLRAEFILGPRTYGRLFALVHSQHAFAEGKPRWGDKSLHLELRAGRVFEQWPDARIVQLIRDPRDRFASSLKRAADKDGGKEAKGVAAATGRWIKSVVHGIRNESAHPGRYMTLRYETLVADPVNVTMGICDFFGLDFEPEMMEMRAVEEQHVRGGNSSFGVARPGGISTRSVGRYSDVLKPLDVAFMEVACGQLMRRLDYEPSADLGTQDRLRYALELPGKVIRLEGWLLASGLIARKGGKVPAHRFAESHNRSA